MLCDANGTPLRFLLSGGQASDISYAQPLLDAVSSLSCGAQQKSTMGSVQQPLDDRSALQNLFVVYLKLASPVCLCIVGGGVGESMANA